MKKLFLLLFFISQFSYASNWECINRWMGLTCHTWKMRTPTGWIVGSESYDKGEYALTFVPDPNHEWRE